MATWKYKINVKEEWKKAQNDEISLQELAGLIATKLETLPCYKDEDLQTIVEDLENFSEDPSGTKDDFDYVWEAVYDWGDTILKDGWPQTRMCWIGTF